MESIRKNTWLALLVLLAFVLLAVVLWRAGGARATPDQYGGIFTTPPTQSAAHQSPAGTAGNPTPASHTAVSTEPEDGGGDGGGGGDG
jgi:hypothetical protein